MADVGYIRVSSVDQNTDRQLANVNLTKIFTDKISGSVSSRPALSECLNYVREGDVLHIHSIDRLARNLVDLQKLLHDLTNSGVAVRFHQENLTFDGQSSPMQNLMFQVMGAFAEFEKAIIKERQREGIAKAKALGKHLGRPKKLSDDQRQAILVQYKAGETPATIAHNYHVDVSTIHKLIRRNQLCETS